jgi:iron complex outermembrane receptor protein
MKFQTVSFCLLLPLCFQLAAADAAGDPAGDKEGLPDFSNLTLQELSSVKVTSVSKKQQSLARVAAAVYVISQEDIHRSGMTTVADLLRLVPGLSVARLNSSTWAVASRGFNARFANKLLVLIDGRSIYNSIFAGVNWDMSMPLLDDIDRIEVIRGPGASVWGADAVAGVINIITKSAGETHGGSVTAGGGTTERAFGQVRFSGKVADGIFYRGYLSGHDRSASPTGGGGEAHDGWSDEQGGFRLDGATRNGGWRLEGDLFRNQRQEVGNLPSAQAGYAQVPTNGQFTGVSSNLSFEWRRRMTETSELRVTTSYTFVNRPESGLPGAETSTGDLEVQYRFTPAKNHEVSVGIGDRLNADRTTGSGLISFNPSHLTYQLASGFAQDEIHLLNDRLLLTFGAKIEHDLFAGWQLQPTARALWAPNKRHSFWASASQAARTPTFYERDVTAEVASAPPSPATYGLPLVAQLNSSSQYRAEILRAYETGYRAQLSPRFSIDIAAFYNDYNHLRTEDRLAAAVAMGPPPYLLLPFVFTNRLRAKAVGGEVSMSYHPVSRWKLAGSYSYSNVHSRFADNTPPGTIDASPNATPDNQWKIQSFLNLSKTVQFDSFLFSTSSIASPVYPYGQILLPPHTRVDVRLGWRVTPQFEVSLSGQDLLSPRHIELIPEALEPAGYAVRGYYLKTNWRF